MSTQNTRRLTMAQALIQFLDNQYLQVDGKEIKFIEGILGIFGHGCVLGIGEALQEGNHHLRFYQGHNEQGMAHTAIAYAKQHRRQKIMAVTSSIGPGAANMVTAAALATVNRIPLLLLPGDVFACRQPDPVLQQLEVFHDYTVSTNHAFKPVCRYWDRIERPEQLITAALQAMRVLTDPAETGAVCLALPQDVQGEAWDYPHGFFRKRVHRIEPRTLSPAALERAANIIAASKKPLLICGGGVKYAQAREELLAFVESFQIPVGETQAGKDLLPWDHPLNMGGIGVTGTLAANRAAREADLILAAGTRLSDFTTSSKGGFASPSLGILTLNVCGFDGVKMDAEAFLCDAREGLKALIPALKKRNYQSEFAPSAAGFQKAWFQESRRLYETDLPEGLSQTRVLGVLNEELLPANAVVVGASGSLPGDLQRLWRCREEGSYHMEYGYSCMGYEVAGALGAKLADPDREVYSFTGDGSYLMLHSEIFTSIQEGVKINILLFDNHGFHCIDNLQTSQGIPSFGCEFLRRNPQTGQLDGEILPIDFAANAASYGCRSWTVETLPELRRAFAQAKESPVSTLIHIKVLPKSMSGGQESWWRVGTPEVSPTPGVEEAARRQKTEVRRAGKF